MKQLIHNGVLIPQLYESRGFSIIVKGTKITLTAEQEEMAVAWVKKIGTEYTEDKTFSRNFFRDFSKALGLKKTVSHEDCDFSQIIDYIEREREDKEQLTKEEKKRLAAERKMIREGNKELYGYAMIDGKKVELGNYTVEPSSIFMGRGKHPLRGRWKRGAQKEDIELNISPDATRPSGNWKGILWRPNEMWIARWNDSLRNVKKYVWLADSSPLKQNSEIEKFDKTITLGRHIKRIKSHIDENLESPDPMKRKIATVCALIDILKFRVGDEKDKDEVDTVGATTLRPEHIQVKSEELVVFDFLGKDSIRYHKEISLPRKVVSNIREFVREPSSSIFKGVRSDNVSTFLSEVTPKISAKVFRTYHSTKVVEKYLRSIRVSRDDADYVKKNMAVMANLQAAITCNHRRKIPKNWKKTLEKRVERLKTLKAQIEERRLKELERLKTRINDIKSKKPTPKRCEVLKKYREKQRLLKKEKYTPSQRERIRKMNIRIDLMKATKDYNLNTSLKSYIDPRVFYKWSQRIDFDWRNIYPKTLQKKFSWVERSNPRA